MDDVLLLPPIVFIIVFAALNAASYVFSRLSFKPKPGSSDESRKAYACGEDIKEHRVQVDYRQFFTFAFFFTILHVVALMVATVPTENMDSFFIALLYISGAIVGLMILFRR